MLVLRAIAGERADTDDVRAVARRRFRLGKPIHRPTYAIGAGGAVRDVGSAYCT